MSLKSQVVESPTFYFELDEKGNPVTWIDVEKLSIKGYPGLIFYLNDSIYPIMIYNSDGSWNWNVEKEIGLKSIKFNPSSFDANKKIIVLTS